MAANPYVEARREWDERYADLVLGKRNWQIAAGGSLLLSLILAGGMVWLITRSRYVPYVVEVDKLGYALTVPQPLTPTSIPDVTARMQRYEVAAFIRSARSVSSDPQVEHQMLNSLLAHRAARPTDSLTLIFTPTASLITLSSSRRSKPSRSRSIRSFSFRLAAIRCGGQNSSAI
jgi:type IV secretion system protein VirB5